MQHPYVQGPHQPTRHVNAEASLASDSQTRPVEWHKMTTYPLKLCRLLPKWCGADTHAFLPVICEARDGHLLELLAVICSMHARVYETYSCCNLKVGDRWQCPPVWLRKTPGRRTADDLFCVVATCIHNAIPTELYNHSLADLQKFQAVGWTTQSQVCSMWWATAMGNWTQWPALLQTAKWHA